MNVTDEEEQMAFMDECKEKCMFIESIEISNFDKLGKQIPLLFKEKMLRLIAKS